MEEERQREGGSGQEEGEEAVHTGFMSPPPPPPPSSVSLWLQEVEYNLLEEKLQKTLSDLERREKHLTEAELEVRAAHVMLVIAGVCFVHLET